MLELSSASNLERTHSRLDTKFKRSIQENAHDLIQTAHTLSWLAASTPSRYWPICGPAPRAATNKDSTSFLAGSASRCVVSEDWSVGGAPWLVFGIDIARCGMETLCGHREERMLADRATTNSVRPCMSLVNREKKGHTCDPRWGC